MHSINRTVKQSNQSCISLTKKNLNTKSTYNNFYKSLFSRWSLPNLHEVVMFSILVVSEPSVKISTSAKRLTFPADFTRTFDLCFAADAFH